MSIKVNKNNFLKVVDSIEAGKEYALTACALDVQSDATRKAPRDTGTLAGSISVDDSIKGKRLVGTNIVYAAAQEFGYENIPAQPYLRPALHGNREAIRGKYASILKAYIKKAST